MRKIFSISLSILMVATIMHFSVATHYCGGKMQSSVISISGKVSGCGMENNENLPPSGDFQFSRHCCDNEIIYCTLTSNFFPSFSFVPEITRHYFQNSFYISNLNIPVQPVISICKNESPPGTIFPNSVDLTNICIFRI